MVLCMMIVGLTISYRQLLLSVAWRSSMS